MKVGLYFGSFNPIHTGHCIIANHLLMDTDLEQVWLIISPQNPFKPAHTLLNEYHRLHLAQVAVEDAANLKASDIELHLPKPSYTIDTLTHLQEKYPQHKFVVIMGSDSFHNLPKWKNPEIIKKNYEIYVYLRPGYPVNEGNHPKIKVLEAPLLQISSTHIRDCIRKRQSIRFLVPDKVMDEIEKNGYYK